MNSENMRIWNHAAKTDTSATKKTEVNGHKQTSINTLWPIKKATELWGPIGKGWGYEIIEDRVDVGGPIMGRVDDKDQKICDTQTHTLRLRLWYKDSDDTCFVEQYGHTPYVYRSKWGATTDTEAPKKSLSDAIKKCLSMLGFCSDIFMGQFDDQEYVEQIQTEQFIEKAEAKAEAEDEKRQALIDYVEKHKRLIDESKSINEINGIVRVSVRHLEYQKNIPALKAVAERGINAIARLVEERKKQLLENSK